MTFSPKGALPWELTRSTVKKNDVVQSLRRVIEGTRSHGVPVSGEPLRAEAFLVATGSLPRIPDIPGLHEAGYLTSATLFELDELPPSLVVLGGGYIGLEFAQAFSRLGSDVTVIVRSQVARNEEPPIRDALVSYLREEGITILESTHVASVGRDGAARVLHLQDAAGNSQSLNADAILAATGRSANTHGLALDTAGIRTSRRGAIVIDEHLKTSNPRVWAAGDCCDVPSSST